MSLKIGFDQLFFVSSSCETNIDDCSSSPCANGGLCTDLINGYLCNCTKDYISANCSISLNETCLGRFNRCQHNGTCLLKSAHLYVDHPQTECQCRDGYNGSLCQNDLCLTLNCQHNGVCQRLPNGQAKCVCTEQWQGKTCEDDVDECTSNPCLHNGTCMNNDGGYSCRCREFYLGQHCERKHTCLEYTPCLNNGLCRAQDEHYYCECSTNFTGTNQSTSERKESSFGFEQVSAVNYPPASRYHVKTTARVRQIVNKAFYAIVQIQVKRFALYSIV